MGLKEYILRRLILMIPVALGAVLLVFAVTQILPAEQRAFLFVRNTQHITMDDINLIIAHQHLRDSPIIQFGYWLAELLQGNWGYSRVGRGPVLDVILQRWPGTIEIVIFAAPIIILLGIVLGTLSARFKDTPLDWGTRLFSISGYSLPSFWLGMVLLASVFAATGIWLTGRVDTNYQVMVTSGVIPRTTGLYTLDGIFAGRLDLTLNAIAHVILPVTVIVVINVSGLLRLMRSSMLEALTKGYVITATAKGLKRSEVINKHARRNALIPVITVSGMMVAGLLGGLVITETVFGFQGLGQWVAQASGVGTGQPDTPAIVGFTLITALMFVISNLVVDVLYAYIDPRIRLG